MKRARLTGAVLLLGTLIITASQPVSAATSPNLGAADPFSVLSSTYTNTAAGTTINGDVGYVTPPAMTPTINGNVHVANGTYNQAGIDQNAARTLLDAQPCTHTFPSGAIDLASDTTHGTIGVYMPGVYCITGAADIGGGGTITLDGNGTYIFRMTGALDTSAGSIVAVTNGASACDTWWTPGAATTLGANTTFMGTNINASGITVGNTVTWTGRALAFGGTVTTSSDTISTVPMCAAASTSSSASATSGAQTPGLPNSGLSADKDASFLDAGNALLLTCAAAMALVIASRLKRTRS
jgi:hypothetical protein